MDGSEQEKMELVVSLPASATYRQEDDFPPSPALVSPQIQRMPVAQGSSSFFWKKNRFFLTKPPSDFPRMADQHDECCMSGLCHMTHYFLHALVQKR